MGYIVMGVLVFIAAIVYAIKLPIACTSNKNIPICPPADNTDIKLKDALRYAKVVPYVDEVENNA